MKHYETTIHLTATRRTVEILDKETGEQFTRFDLSDIVAGADRHKAKATMKAAVEVICACHDIRQRRPVVHAPQGAASWA